MALLPAPPPQVLGSTGDAGNAHFFVGEAALVDDDVVVECDRAVTHRDVIVSLGRALAAALRIGPGREQEIAGEATRARVMPCRIGAIECDRIPASLWVQPPPKMRDCMSVHVLRIGAIALEPVIHELGIEAPLDVADEAVANVNADL